MTVKDMINGVLTEMMTSLMHEPGFNGPGWYIVDKRHGDIHSGPYPDSDEAMDDFRWLDRDPHSPGTVELVNLDHMGREASSVPSLRSEPGFDGPGWYVFDPRTGRIHSGPYRNRGDARGDLRSNPRAELIQLDRMGREVM